MDRTQILNNARILWNFMVIKLPVEPADVILCLGSHDTNVAIRAAELFKQGIAPYIFVSGGKGKITSKTFPSSEAEIFSSIMENAGVPWGKIIRENWSTNIGENLQNSKVIIKDRLPYVKSVCVVTKPPAERRVLAAFEKQMSDFSGYVTSPRLSFNWYVSNFYKTQEEVDEMINMLVSDQVKVDVPNKMYQLADTLKQEGYNKYC